MKPTLISSRPGIVSRHCLERRIYAEHGKVTPGISALEYHHRRAALAKKLPRNSIAVLASSELKFRSSAVFYEFHQEPNFYYLTGEHEHCCEQSCRSNTLS